nr:Gfo/Idh/MocA family oxidoreductase [Schumannella luteola]
MIEDAAAHEMDIVAWLAGEPVVSVEVRRGKSSRHARDGVSDPIMLLLRTESGVLADVEINMSSQAAYQVATEAVFEAGSVVADAPEGPTTLHDGRRHRAVDRSYVGRFAAAYDREFQEWVDGLRGVGDGWTGASAWDGLLTVALCEAGIAAARSGARADVVVEQRPSIYVTLP